MTYDQWKTESGYSEREECADTPDTANDPYPWMRHFDASGQSALMYKVLDFIDKDNVFGDHFSEYDRLRIITLLGRPWKE